MYTFMKISITLCIVCCAVLGILFVIVLSTSEKSNRGKVLEWLHKKYITLFCLLGTLIIAFLAMTVISGIW